MVASAVSPPGDSCPAHLHAAFLTIIPIVERQARFAFRYLHCPHDRDEAVAETVAVSWKWFQTLADKGKDATTFPTALADRAARHVKSGRHLCGQENGKDVMSATARRRHGFQVERLQVYGPEKDVHWQDALIDNIQTPADEAVAFRIDFPEWLARLSDRDQRMAEQMAVGEKTSDVARKFGLSWSRVSQLRRVYHESWQAFHGEAAGREEAVAAHAA